MAIRIKLAKNQSSSFRLTAGKRAEFSTQDVGGQPLPRFSAVAYTGIPVNLAEFDLPLIVDLASIQAAQSVAVLKNHDPERILGHSTSVNVTATEIDAAGLLSAENDDSAEAARLGKNGFPWQVSIGCDIGTLTFVDVGQTVTVNGREWTGPLYVAGACVLREISLCPLGADGNTSAVIAARSQGVKAMKKFKAWAKAAGFTDDDMNDEAKCAVIQQAYIHATGGDPQAEDDPEGGDGDEEPRDGNASATATLPAVRMQATATTTAATAVAEMQRATAGELRRQSAIRALCSRHQDLQTEVEVDGKPQRVNILMHAMENGWSAQTTELHILRAARAEPPITHSGTGGAVMNARVLECAVMQAGGHTFTEADAREYPDQVQQAAHTAFLGRIGLQQLMTSIAASNGYRGSEVIRTNGQLQQVVQFGFGGPAVRMAEGASYIDGGNIFANVMNKFMLAGYNAVDASYQYVCAKRSVKDFKPTKSIALLGDTMFEQVGKDGELKHGKLGDQAFANQADTYGKLLTITRQDTINDDLGILTATPKKIGRGGALKRNQLVWGVYMNPGNDDGGSTAFYAATHTLPKGQSGNANYKAGTDTVLSSGGLTIAQTMFRNQVDPDGDPLACEPAVLVVGPSNEVTAMELLKSINLVYGGASAAKQGNLNVFSGRFKLAVSPYLENTNYTGNSLTAWYLQADPADIPVLEICYLNGVEEPTVQSVAAAPGWLAIIIEGFLDMGVAAQNFRGGVKMKGAA